MSESTVDRTYILRNIASLRTLLEESKGAIAPTPENAEVPHCCISIRPTLNAQDDEATSVICLLWDLAANEAHAAASRA